MTLQAKNDGGLIVRSQSWVTDVYKKKPICVGDDAYTNIETVHNENIARGKESPTKRDDITLCAWIPHELLHSAPQEHYTGNGTTGLPPSFTTFVSHYPWLVYRRRQRNLSIRIP